MRRKKRGKKQNNKNEGPLGKNSVSFACSSTLFLVECDRHRGLVCVESVRGEKLIRGTVNEMLIEFAGCPDELQVALPPFHGPESHY